MSDSLAVNNHRRDRHGAYAGAVWRPPPGKRGAFLLERLLAVGQGGVRLRPLGATRAGEVRLGRFLHNDRVTPSEMVATARTRTAGLVQGRHVLVIQDTTSLRDDGDQRSLHLHPAIAVDASDGALLGLVDAVFLHRRGGKRGQHNNQPFAEKESRRWLDASIQAACLAQAGASGVTVIGDREGDIYEMFACRPAKTELVIRVQHDRVLDDGARLFDCTAALAELGRETVVIPAAPGRPAREAVLALRARSVRPRRPHRNRAREAAALPAAITLSLVEAREINAPAGVTPAHWRLLTTHGVTSLVEAQRITHFYRQRWTIEQLFRVMKTKGFDIEAVRVSEGGAFENLATATLIAAIQVLQMVRARDGDGGRALADAFEAGEQGVLEAVCATLEGKTARQKNPHAKGSLAYGAWVCARLGGWTGYYGKPGPIVILQGLLRFKAIRHGWQLARDV